jgi:hypothetical protein
MAAKVEKPQFTAVAVGAAVFLLNWFSAQYWSYPFAWCWGKQLQPIFEPWLFVIHFMALGYFVLCIMSRDAFKVAQGLMVAIVIFSVPTFMEILFRLGKSCG